jgi:hypothetical protein
MCGVLAASAVLLGAGAAFSGGTSTTNVELVDFNRYTGELFAYPKGRPLVTFLQTGRTVHLPTDLIAFTPPDPCLPLAVAWNNTVEFDRTNDVTSTAVFDVLLGVQSNFGCRAVVTSINTGAVRPILSITPAAR